MSGPQAPPLDAAARERLLALARHTLEHHLGGAPPPSGGAPVPSTRGGLFVTLRVRGELVGCIGWLHRDEPLERAVPRCALAAASSDPRFPPVRREELEALRIEISVLSEPVPVASIDEIEPGNDGLWIEQGDHRGLLLPQVATEQGWDRIQFLTAVCRKAGLAADAWARGAALWRFRATVFAEP